MKGMRVIRVSKAGPSKKGPLKTSQKPLTKASPQRANVTNQIATNYPINFGVGGKSSPKSGGMKSKRGKAMY